MSSLIGNNIKFSGISSISFIKSRGSRFETDLVKYIFCIILKEAIYKLKSHITADILRTSLSHPLPIQGLQTLKEGHRQKI